MELYKIAINFQTLSSITISKLKKAAVLLGSHCIQQPEGPIDDDDGHHLEYKLLASNEVAIVDNITTFQHFGEVIFCAPQEDTLEGE